MKNFTRLIGTMTLTGILLMVFAVSIGVATFIENDFGSQVARDMVYGARWFEGLLLLLALNLCASIIVNKLYRIEKLTIGIFHFAFIVMLIGSGITRYISYEGTMHIREGETTNILQSEFPHFKVNVSNETDTVVFETSEMLKPSKSIDFSETVKIGDKSILFEKIDFVPNAYEAVEPDGNGVPIVSFAAAANKAVNNYYLKKGTVKNLQDFRVGYSVKGTDFHIFDSDSGLMAVSRYTVLRLRQDTAAVDTFKSGTSFAFKANSVYSTNGNEFMLKGRLPKGRIVLKSDTESENSGYNGIMFKVTSGEETSEIILFGGKGITGVPAATEINGVTVNAYYGAKNIELPFSLKLNDFLLERYPGSMSPSSFESKVNLIDEALGLDEPRRIFMNNVLNHKGYKFFQSSYDTDEKGTVLSVSYDFAGMLVTYIGYTILIIGMFISLLNKSSYFIALGKKGLNTGVKVLIPFALFVLANGTLNAQDNHDHAQQAQQIKIDKEQAELFGSILVQTRDGRIQPLNTYSGQILRKVARKTSFDGYSADEVLLGMHMNPGYWQTIRLIRVGNTDLADFLGINGKYASFSDFIDSNGSYRLAQKVQEAYAKRPAEQSKMDKEIINVDERVNICYQIYIDGFLKLFPEPGDATHTWYSPADELKGMKSEDSTYIRNVFNTYFSEYRKSIESGNFAMPTQLLESIRNYQELHSAAILPSATKQKIEIAYNNAMIFERIAPYYGLIGFIMLVLLFTQIVNKKLSFPRVLTFFKILIFIGFAFHTLGLGLRWYIAGHAPWSNGYESMIYVAWATILAGFFFIKKSPFVQAATGVLAALTLMVAHLSWMNPEITTLVPVLKSYWLTLHVSVITSSYGFFGLAAVLGLLNMSLYLTKTKFSALEINNVIAELSAISGRVMIVGLYLLTAGTFLGAVWANESWGRYWGWDPKETWSLVTILVYSFVIHMRNIPGFRGNFALNLGGITSLISVLMTYFGVNYYLAGLHSYAKGDPIPVPTFVYYTVIIVALLIIFAYLNHRKIEAAKK